MKSKKSGAKAPNEKFYITHITSNDRLSKEFYLSPQGKIKARANAYLVEGEYDRKAFKSLNEFSEFLNGLSSNSALTYGLFKGDKEGIVISREKKEGDPEKFETAMTRTRDDMRWPVCRAILFLDYDPGKKKALTQKELVEALKKACPFLENLEMLCCPSASSYIKDRKTGETLVGLKGQHVYIIVEKGAQIPEIGKAIEDRLWLAGYGRFDVSRAGTLLERTLIDSTVFQPERLDFVGKIIAQKPLAKIRKSGSIITGKQKFLSIEMIPPLTKEEKTKIENLKCVARQEAEKERVIVRERYIKKRVKKLAGAGATKDQIARNRKIVEAALEYQVLYGDFILLSQGGNRVKVSDLLEMPEKYHQTRFADPLEPEYNDDSRIAYANLKTDKPYIYSHAHGGRMYKLRKKMPVIIIEGGNSHRVIDKSIEILRGEDDLFEDSKGQTMIRVSQKSSSVVSSIYLTDRLSRLAYFERFDGRKKEIKQIDPPERIAKIILEKNGERKLPKLEGICTAPTITTKGRIIKTSGYDKDEGVFLVDTEDYPEIPIKPTIQEVKEAYEKLKKPFKDFPYAGESDWCVLLAGILTTVIRPCLPTAPAFAFDAPAPGSGKSLLAQCIGIIAAGSEPTTMPPFYDEAECVKIILPCLMQGSSAFVFDNFKEKIESEALAMLLTAKDFSGRILGQSQIVSVPAKAIVMFTGNNLEIVGDLNRRILICRINPNVDASEVWKREFPLNPVKYCLENRKEIVSAALTIFAGYFAAGQPKIGRGRLASFEDWSDTVRQTILWLDKMGIAELVDPMEILDKQARKDSETEELGKLLEAWYLCFKNTPKAVKDVLKCIEKQNKSCLKDALDNIVSSNDNYSSKTLGKWIAKRKDKVVNGLRFVRLSKRTGGVVWWKVEKVNSGLSGISGLKEPEKEKMKKKKKDKAKKQPPEATNPLLQND